MGTLSRSARRAEFLGASITHRAADGPRIEATLEQALPELALTRHPQKEPGEREEGHDRAFDHHHGAGKALILEWREPPQPLAVLVHGIEGGARPEEDVPEHRLDSAHDGDVPELRA